MKSSEIVHKYIQFFKKRGHEEIPNVSLIPVNDPTLLYVNSGMFPLVPYLSGESHPSGKRLVNIQRALRFFEDIDNVGNTNRHTTAFHMLGNWSLGDYFKKEQLNWIYEFFIEVLGLDIGRIYATVYAGDGKVSEDTESLNILKNIFAKYGIKAKKGERIFAYGREDNWWQRGEALGELGGPDSEIFYYIGKNPNPKNSPAENQEEFLEIGNSVFMQYKKIESGWGELSQKNVDFGAGLERLALVLQQKEDIFETDNFLAIINKLEELSGKKYHEDKQTKKAMRVIADHMRASTLLIMDGIMPSNKEQGYILRRLIRRIIRFGKHLGIEKNIGEELFTSTSEVFNWLYPNLYKEKEKINSVFTDEESRFSKILQDCEKQLSKELAILPTKLITSSSLASLAFNIFQSSGYPLEMTLDALEERNLSMGNKIQITNKFKELLSQHQAISRRSMDRKFKGGLADNNSQTVKYHTATHLIHQALFDVLDKVRQEGSNITSERLRFDFSSEKKPTTEDIKNIEKKVNGAIKKNYPVHFEIMPKIKAYEVGARSFFKEKYNDQVKIYFIGDYSKEFCGGPHVDSTKEIEKIEIFKFEKIGTNIYRIYAR